MQIQKLWKTISISAIMAVLLLGYTNCSQPKVSENVAQSDLPSVSSRLTLNPANKTIPWGGTQQFSVTGGTPPYFYKVVSGAGTIDYYNGTYVAPSIDRTTVIQVTDAAGAVSQTNVTASFNSSGSFALALSSNSIHPGDTIALTASGGVAPYTYMMVSGVGSITGSNYYASSYGTGVIGVRDSRGIQASFSVTVEPNLTINSYPVYRHYHTLAQMFLYDKSATVADWNLQTSFKVLANSSYLNTLPLIRCYINSAQGRYLSVGSCSSYTNEGTLGYVFAYAAQNTTPLYSCFKSSNGKYLISTSYQECVDNGFSVQSPVLGHVPL